jgi:hypothetical protein
MRGSFVQLSCVASSIYTCRMGIIQSGEHSNSVSMLFGKPAIFHDALWSQSQWYQIVAWGPFRYYFSCSMIYRVNQSILSRCHQTRPSPITDNQDLVRQSGCSADRQSLFGFSAPRFGSHTSHCAQPSQLTASDPHQEL